MWIIDSCDKCRQVFQGILSARRWTLPDELTRARIAGKTFKLCNRCREIKIDDLYNWANKQPAKKD